MIGGSSIFIFLLLVCVLVVNSKVPILPKDFPKCHRSDPDLDACWIRGSETMRKYMKSGIPALNIPSMDPFIVPQISIQQGTPNLNIKAVLTNTNFKGLTNYKMNEFHFDVPNLLLSINGTIDNLELAGDYEINANFIVAPIEGKGKCIIKVGKSYFYIIKKLDIVQRNGVAHLNGNHTNTTINVGNPQAKFDGLFDGNEELSKVTQKVIDDNIDVLFQELKPVIEKIITGIMDDIIVKGIENNIPYDELYPK